MIGFIITILLLVYISLIYTSPALLSATVIVMVMSLMSVVSLVKIKKQTDVRILSPIQYAAKNCSVRAELHITNKSTGVCKRLKATAVVKNASTGEKHKVILKVNDICPGNNVSVYSISFPNAGVYELRLKNVSLYDMLGIYGIKLSVASSLRVTIIPTAFPMNVQREPREVSAALVKNALTCKTEEDDFFQSRLYRPGDPLHSIHWKLSEKYDELYVRESGQSVKTYPAVLLDFRFDKQTRSFFDTFLSVAASVLQSLIRNGCEHYVEWRMPDGDAGRMRISTEDDLMEFWTLYLSMENKSTKAADASTELFHDNNMDEIRTVFRIDKAPSIYRDGEKIADIAGANPEKAIGGIRLVV